MKAKIDLYKFVRSLMERYYDKIHIDRTTTECWLDSVLEDQGLEYKDGEIVEIKQEQVDDFDAVEPFRIKKGEWYVCIHDFCNKAIQVGEIIQAEHDNSIREFDFLYMENKYFRPAFENEKPQVDGFDAELNALLKKYKHLPNDKMIECLKWYTAELINNK